MAYNPEYYRNYYQTHKKELSERRRKKYRSDPSHRAQILARARAASVLRSMQRAERRKNRFIVHNGRKEPYYYLTGMESVVNRDKDVLFAWRNSNPPIIPAATHQDQFGRKIYAESQVRFVASVLHKIDTGETAMTYQDLRHILENLWSETFSEPKTARMIREVLHGKHYEEDREVIWKKAFVQKVRPPRTHSAHK